MKKLIASAKMNAKLDGIHHASIDAYIKGDGGMCDDHEYVEIGGIKWATMNVGAKKVTDTGLYFQWGDTKGYTADDVRNGVKRFNWGNYKFSTTDGGFNKYNGCYGDNLTELMSCDDAVATAWGNGWRMPTDEEFKTLCETTYHMWVDNYNGSDVSGMLFVDKTDSSKVLFFPATGICSDGDVYYVGGYGLYWSSSLDGNIVSAYYLHFDSGGVNWQYYSSCCHGFSVRGVVAEKLEKKK